MAEKTKPGPEHAIQLEEGHVLSPFRRPMKAIPERVQSALINSRSAVGCTVILTTHYTQHRHAMSSTFTLFWVSRAMRSQGYTQWLDQVA